MEVGVEVEAAGCALAMPAAAPQVIMDSIMAICSQIFKYIDCMQAYYMKSSTLCAVSGYWESK
jgi:hypothetical protein